MLDQERKAFALLIDALAANFGKPAEEPLLEAYWRALRDLPLGAVEQAVDAALRQCKHMPRGVELRELAGEIPNTSRAVLAWAALQKAIGQHGAYRSVDFDDPVINATVRNLGGWQRLCAMPVEEFEKWLRKDFERVYASLCSSGVSQEAVAYLPGIHEQSNVSGGHEVKPPLLIAAGLPAHRAGLMLGGGRLRLASGDDAVQELVSKAAHGTLAVK